MIHVARASAALLRSLVLQDEQTGLEPLMLADPAYVDALASSTWSWALQRDGQAIAAGGVVEIWAGRGFAWCLVGRDVLGHFGAARALHRIALEGLSVAPFRRIEAAVRTDWPAARKWAERLGFQCEAEAMSAFDPLGRSCALYARVRGAA